MKYATSLFLFLLAAMPAFGASPRNVSPVSIVDHIRAGRIHSVILPDSLAAWLMPQALPADSDSEATSATEEAERSPAMVNGKAVGFRVQIFSDNNPRTAKSQVRAKQRSVASRFPSWRTYVSFNSPYWRLKVGDFRTEHDAYEAAEEIKRAFPGSAKEIRVVRDRINITN